LYTSKSTQEEDSEKQVQIGCAVIKRKKCVLEEKHHGISEDQSTDAMIQARKEPSFGEGLSKSSRIECSNNKKCHQCYNGTSHTLQ
jgi:hypothetical protein